MTEKSAVTDIAAEAGPDTGSASAGSQSPDPTVGPAVILVRHGETEWSRSGQHTGRTDIDLTAVGIEQARAAGALVTALLAGASPSLVISSPRTRAVRTAELAGFPATELSDDAAEWDYGDFEGRTSAEIRRSHPGWTIWKGPVPGGEDAAAVTVRVDRLLARVHEVRATATGPVLIFSHGHASRCVAARWLREPVTFGSHLSIGTGSASALGFEHGRPAIARWNIDPTVIPAAP